MHSHLYDFIYCSNFAQARNFILATYRYDPIIYPSAFSDPALLFLLTFYYYHVPSNHSVYLKTLYKRPKKKKKNQKKLSAFQPNLVT